MSMKEYRLLTPYRLGKNDLKNRVVMSPMTRSRALGNIPNDLMARYYEQRSGAGLIITEGTSPSPDGLGYSRIPGIYSRAQVEGWKKITAAVHKSDCKIYVQLMHTGRISHPENMPVGARVLAPSALKANLKMWTDTKQMQELPVPEEMTISDIFKVQKEYTDAAVNAIEAGFDGVEIHGANGYLPEQFVSPFSNTRTDDYGGNIENRCRFILETVASISEAIGKERVGIRLSPYSTAGDMPHYSEIDDTYKYLAELLGNQDISYIHVADHSSRGGAEVPLIIKKEIRRIFRNSVIISGGYDLERAEADLNNGLGDLVAFARLFISNPDLVERFKNNWPVSKDLRTDLFYASGAKGYTDYPEYEEEYALHEKKEG